PGARPKPNVTIMSAQTGSVNACLATRLAAGLVALLVAVAHATDKAECGRTDDCLCGTLIAANECGSGSSAQIAPGSESRCLNLCTTLTPYCRSAHCVLDQLSPCPVDCDGNLVTTIDELTLAAGIILGESPSRSCPASSRVSPLPLDVAALIRGVNSA